VVVVDPAPKLDDSVEVRAALEVGDVSEAELCLVAVFEELLVSLFAIQHAGVPSGSEQQYRSSVIRVIGTAPISSRKAAGTAVHFALRRASSSTAGCWRAIR
jgi:hypothetical protein